MAVLVFSTGGRTTIMGIKQRVFEPLPNFSLEELVPEDNFYRRLEATLDLSFVRDLVKDCYVCSGRPSVDPVVFFRLQLVMFFEDIRFERRLVEVAANRLSIRWYLGYDLNEPLPDHSSLTRILKSATVLRSSAASLSGSCRCARRRDWCGERNSTSTQPRLRQTLL